MTPADAVRQTAEELYPHVVRGQAPMTLEEFLDWLGEKPAFAFKTASPERNMFRLSWAARAIGAGLWEHWEETIEPAVSARLAKTPWTNYSGD